MTLTLWTTCRFGMELVALGVLTLYQAIFVNLCPSRPRSPKDKRDSTNVCLPLQGSTCLAESLQIPCITTRNPVGKGKVTETRPTFDTGC